MKFFQKRSVAVLIMVAAIVLSSLYGRSKAPAPRIPEGGPALDTTLSTAAYRNYIADEANVLSSATEKTLSVYNANWDSWAGSILAVVTVENAPSPLEDAAWNWAEALQLGDNDALLLLDAGGKDAYFLTSGSFYDAVGGRENTYLSACVYEGVQRGDYNTAAESLFGSINLLFADVAVQSSGGGWGMAIFCAVALILLFVILFSILDSFRFSTWRRRYIGVPYPPVYRPILWWHGPRSGWYRRRSAPPPPPRPVPGPRPPAGGGGFGGPRPGGFSGSPRPGGFGGTVRPGGGSFGSSGRVGGGSFGSRGGGFGSSGRTGGGGFSRGGGFGSSGRSGGGGFSRGGGGRGGGFGRR